MVLGVVLGPWGLKLVSDADIVQRTGDVGIIFLLFLLGLHLQPQNLLHMLKKVTWVTLVSSIIFAGIGFLVARWFGYLPREGIIIGVAMMFSSTIIGLKLLPTTVLHHQHTGEVMISVLLMQDLIAIVALLFLNGLSLEDGFQITDLVTIVFALPGLLLFAFLFERYVLRKLFAQFDRVREYMFLLAIGWCLGMAVLAGKCDLSYEIGAFIAGVSIATSPISLYIAESLKPVRDFFLVLFFFSVGASFNLEFLHTVAAPAIVLAALILLAKPITFRVLLQQVSENKAVAWEVGVRLGQISEFSLLVAYVAASAELISLSASYLIQATAILTFIASSYIVVLRYPTPVAISERLRRD
jgi:Kef-type K+ transport system membrane component KefB